MNQPIAGEEFLALLEEGKKARQCNALASPPPCPRATTVPPTRHQVEVLVKPRRPLRSVAGSTRATHMRLGQGKVALRERHRSLRCRGIAALLSRSSSFATSSSPVVDTTLLSEFAARGAVDVGAPPRASSAPTSHAPPHHPEAPIRRRHTSFVLVMQRTPPDLLSIRAHVAAFGHLRQRRTLRRASARDWSGGRRSRHPTHTTPSTKQRGPTLLVSPYSTRPHSPSFAHTRQSNDVAPHRRHVDSDLARRIDMPLGTRTWRRNIGGHAAATALSGSL
uniref:Uncharacterized protein n=1 Tax=Mycena chlorophos TaxID=658473 RepID=A0ABQ0LZF9_MYCCL|nr:predicted protein [Mycena chlorophos]